VLSRAAADQTAVDMTTSLATRLFDPPFAPGEWDPRTWSISFLDRDRDKVWFHARNLTYEWFLKWPWDEWLRRRRA
jgi:hypothetical protein